MFLCFDMWSLRYCPANISVAFTCLTVLDTIMSILNILFLYDLQLWSLSLLPVTMLCIKCLSLTVWAAHLDSMGVGVGSLRVS